MSMKIDVAKSVMNPLLERREVELTINHHGEGTPAKSHIINELNHIYSIPASNIYVYDVKTGFGLFESTAKAHLYSSLETMKKVEHSYVMVRKTGVVPERVNRRTRKEKRKKAAKMFGTLKRNMKKAARRAKED